MFRRQHRVALLALAIAAASSAAHAAYITPWYVNPALKERLWIGADAFTPTDLPSLPLHFLKSAI